MNTSPRTVKRLVLFGVIAVLIGAFLESYGPVFFLYAGPFALLAPFAMILGSLLLPLGGVLIGAAIVLKVITRVPTQLDPAPGNSDASLSR